MNSDPVELSFKLELENRHRRWRTVKDRLFGWAMAVGGISVIITIVMIFFYLFYVVLPMLGSAKIEFGTSYDIPVERSEIAHLSLDEYAEVGFLITNNGFYKFFDANTGEVLKDGIIARGHASNVVAVAAGAPIHRSVILALADGTAVIVRPDYAVSYPNDKRKIAPSLTYPLGPTPINLGLDDSDRLTRVAVQTNSEETTIVAITDNNEMILTHVTVEKSFSGDDDEVSVTHSELPRVDFQVHMLLIDVAQRELFVASSTGQINYFDILNKAEAKLVDVVNALTNGNELTTLESLSGGISILVGDSSGAIAQWFPVRDENNNFSLQKVRSFPAFDFPVQNIVPEFFRKGFVATDAAGNVGLFHTTAGRELLVENLSTEPLRDLAISPRADAILALTSSGEVQKHTVHNEHPEVSWNSIWGKVWYESRSGPEYVWQSSSASSDFEPKFSLTPLTFGTLKASFYAMLFAIPLAILGAIYTAYFMTAKMRNIVKPSIEIMAALPTVILGFLAGLWLAPLIEQHLAGVFISFIAIPTSFLLASAVAENLPASLRKYCREGWEAALLLPVVCFGVWAALALSQPIEIAFFDGSLPQWLSQELGISYDQRNSLVVGMAIGFAVIPTIFSISEDAIFGVPRHLTSGSLALGATPWQTVIGVVILTASPGIFSAVMIGLGRAVGETMIVLMATGNTPIMDVNIFQGFRALSANIAVEMPESEVNSTHFRVLFLAALVLFLVTFIVNTVAEIVRQRLRVKYSNL